MTGVCLLVEIPYLAELMVDMMLAPHHRSRSRQVESACYSCREHVQRAVQYFPSVPRQQACLKNHTLYWAREVVRERSTRAHLRSW